MSQTEIRFSGSGGQGLITAGIILAEAALYDGKNAIQSQSYGPEARGGASKAEVIISNEEIFYPKVQVPDLSLSLTQVATDKYIEETKEDGMIIVDSAIELPNGLDVKNIITLPILQTASEKIGKSIVANIVALGVVAGLTGLATPESVEKAVLGRVPKGTEDLNKMALAEGYKLAESVTVK